MVCSADPVRHMGFSRLGISHAVDVLRTGNDRTILTTEYGQCCKTYETAGLCRNTPRLFQTCSKPAGIM